MPDETPLQRVRALEADNARLQNLLERRGSTAGLRHQIRNTLAMVRDIVRQTSERLEGAEDYVAHLEGRLDAVFRVQNTIALDLSGGVALDMIVRDEFLTQAVSEGHRLSVEGPDVSLQPAAAGALALAVHELATNAVKFGALACPSGRIAVGWAVAPERGQPWLTLRWCESGVANLPARPAERGFGSEVIENVIRYQLGGSGELDFAPGGLRCTIRLPLPARIGGLRGAGDAPGAGDG